MSCRNSPRRLAAGLLGVFLVLCLVSLTWGQITRSSLPADLFGIPTTSSGVIYPITARTGPGSTCTAATLNAALAALGSTQSTLILPPRDGSQVLCTWTLETNVTVPATVYLLVAAPVVVQGGFTLTINGPHETLVGDNWYAGAGTVTFARNIPLGSAESYDSRFQNVVVAGGLPSTSGSMTLPAFSTRAWIDGRDVFQDAVEVTLSGGDGTYFFVMRHQNSVTPGGWTCPAVTYYCWMLSASVPSIPSGTTLLLQVTVAGSAITAVVDQAYRRFVGATTFAAAYTSGAYSTWDFAPGATLTYTGLALVHNGTMHADPAQQIFKSGVTGTLKFGPKTVISPAWFAHAGSGVPTNPWTSADLSGGLREAFAALQERGTLRAAPGSYLFTSLTPAQIDLVVDSAKGTLTLDLTSAHIMARTVGTVLQLNPNADPASSNTDLHTVVIEGGFFDALDPASGQTDGTVTIQGTAINGNGVRNLTIEKTRFRGMNTPILAAVSDTLRVRDCFFRRHAVAVDIPSFWTTGRTVQDVYISENSGSNNAPTSTFFRAKARVQSIQIARNGVANNATEATARFVEIDSGDATGDSQLLFIVGNATEQQAGGKLIEVTRFGTTNGSNIVIRDNTLESPLVVGANVIDLSFIWGFVDIRNNYFGNAQTTGIRLDNMRGSPTNAQDGTTHIEGNHFRQRAAAGGQILNITNTSNHHVHVGFNAMEDFYNGNRPVLVYPAHDTSFSTKDSPTAALAAAATITIAPEDDFININGATIITTITGTWTGHTVRFLFATLNGGMNDGTGNLMLEGGGRFRAREPNESTMTLRYNGTNWQELSRTFSQITETIASAATITVDANTKIVTITGSATINTVQQGGLFLGQEVIFVCQAGATAVLNDGGGNLRLSANFPCTDDDTLTAYFNSTNWIETGRSPN